MEEQTTWKGHSLTLLVFAGIVALSSIFFMLGMLVGRQQGQKIASIATAEAATTKSDAKPALAEEEKPELTFFNSVEKEKAAPALEPAPAADPPPPESLKQAEPQTPRDSINYQVGAVKKSRDADKLLAAVKKKGFKGFILAPAPGEANPFFRVQVGPFSDVIEAESARKSLEASGYKPILKK